MVNVFTVKRRVIAKECRMKINDNVRDREDKGQVARQEKTGVEGQSTLNGSKKENGNANAWNRVLGRKNGLQQKGNMTMPHVGLTKTFENPIVARDETSMEPDVRVPVKIA